MHMELKHFFVLFNVLYEVLLYLKKDCSNLSEKSTFNHHCTENE